MAPAGGCKHVFKFLDAQPLCKTMYGFKNSSLHEIPVMGCLRGYQSQETRNMKYAGDKLIVAQLVNKVPTFYGTMFTKGSNRCYPPTRFSKNLPSKPGSPNLSSPCGFSLLQHCSNFSPTQRATEQPLWKMSQDSSGVFAKFRKAKSFVMSVRPHETTGPPLDGFW
jgi:hypothetical protein